jgi:hypothetical protein
MEENKIFVDKTKLIWNTYYDISALFIISNKRMGKSIT